MNKTINKVFLVIVAVTLIGVILTACGGGKDLSGDYTIEEFNVLLTPAHEAAEKATSEYDTDDEKVAKYSAAYQDAVRKSGFKAGQTFTINGRKSFVSVQDNEMTVFVTDSEHGSSIAVSGTFEDLGWAAMLERDTNIKISFEVCEETNENGAYLAYEKGKLLSPDKPEFKADCSATNGNTTAQGTVVDVYDFKLSKEEIEEKQNNSFNDFSWYNAMLYSSNYIIIEDNIGRQLGVFIDMEGNQPVNIGDRIGCEGFVWDCSDPTFPTYFMDCGLNDSYYVFTE